MIAGPRTADRLAGLLLRLRQNAGSILIVVVGNGASAVLAIVANWIVAIRLGPAGYGLFAIALALMTLLLEIGGPALDTAIVRFAAVHSRNDPLRAEAYFRTGLHLKLLISCALGAGLVLLIPLLVDTVYQNPALQVPLYWMAACLVAANLSTFNLLRLQASERFVSYSILRILPNLLKVVLLILLWAINWFDPGTVAAAWTLCFVLTGLAGLLVGRATPGTPVRPPQDRPYHEIAGFAKWTMLSGVLFSVHSRADVLLLSRFGSATEVGHYMIASNLMVFLDLITSSILVASLPKAAQARSPSEMGAFRRKTLLASIAIAVALLPIYLLADPLITTLLPGYGPAVAPFRVLFWSSIIVLVIYPLYLPFYAQNQPAKVSIASAALALSSVIIGLLIIPTRGTDGRCRDHADRARDRRRDHPLVPVGRT